MKNTHAHIRDGLLAVATEAIDVALEKFAGVLCVSGGVTTFHGRPEDGECQRWIMILELVEKHAGDADPARTEGRSMKTNRSPNRNLLPSNRERAIRRAGSAQFGGKSGRQP